MLKYISNVCLLVLSPYFVLRGGNIYDHKGSNWQSDTFQRRWTGFGSYRYCAVDASYVLLPENRNLCLTVEEVVCRLLIKHVCFCLCSVHWISIQACTYLDVKIVRFKDKISGSQVSVLTFKTWCI